MPLGEVLIGTMDGDALPEVGLHAPRVQMIGHEVLKEEVAYTGGDQLLIRAIPVVQHPWRILRMLYSAAKWPYGRAWSSFSSQCAPGDAIQTCLTCGMLVRSRGNRRIGVE